MSNEKVWAVVKLGGKQYLVTAGARLVTNRLPNKEGEILNIASLTDKLPVSLKVLAHTLGEKVRGLKFKNKVRYIKRYGHRQQQTVLEIVSIGSEEAVPKVKAGKPTVKTEKTDKSPVAKKATPKAKTVKKEKNV